ncbi:hypothetical protein SPRG_16226 [Saprolegnia parasitica CBS 223.65]|uniref:Uncharacterized protein n=1 Tax=Saprolegnia parasitica (strain CBS 223.65) TaxID=695850 RepID=A0A067BJQ8_SAPPC|nr:hypothetical protein SPRG_16226 [Saprolegnia parasitica CBS 223.65]KDO18413.1 hypothetical protein SPRG_16226 [Saprolegnia parasitica CBS 223.65]|eukprot:XP_012210878.1 hypothetical protein SPRG_16226 [Saprolegnia parasitica CBS 223.65]
MNYHYAAENVPLGFVSCDLSGSPVLLRRNHMSVFFSATASILGDRPVTMGDLYDSILLLTLFAIASYYASLERQCAGRHVPTVLARTVSVLSGDAATQTSFERQGRGCDRPRPALHRMSAVVLHDMRAAATASACFVTFLFDATPSFLAEVTLYVADGVYESAHAALQKLAALGASAPSLDDSVTLTVDVVCDVSWGMFEAQVEELPLWQAAITHVHVSPAKSSQTAWTLHRLLYILYPFAPSVLQVERDALLAASEVLELVPDAHRWFVSQVGLASDAGDCALTVVSASDVPKRLLLLLLLTHLATPPCAPLSSIELASAIALEIKLDLKVVGRLLNAAWNGKLADVQYYLDKGVNVKCTDSDGWTPLHYAASGGQVDVVRILLDKGVDVDAPDVIGYTPLHRAAESKKSEIVELLLGKGAKIDAKNKLFDALRNKRIDDAMRILQKNFLYGNLRDSSETPLLHLVVATQDLSLLQTLLRKPDLKIDAKDSVFP